MKKAFSLIVGLLLLAALVLFSTTYTVRFNEVAVKTTFGKTDERSVKREPGVHFRFPLFADRVTKYDTRIQLVETPLFEVPTADGQSVVVRAFLLWQVDVDNVLSFFRSFPSADDSERMLRDELNAAVKASLGRYDFDDLIGPGSRLGEAEQQVQGQLASLPPLGVRPVTVGISQMVLPPKTTTAVLSRMQAVRNTLAETERFKGDAEADQIRGDARSMAGSLQAFADQRAEEIKALANRKAAEYLKQMSEDQRLAIFLVWLDALEKGLGDSTTLFLSDELAPWHLMDLKRLGEAEAGSIPQPSRNHIDAEEVQTPAEGEGPASERRGP